MAGFPDLREINERIFVSASPWALSKFSPRTRDSCLFTAVLRIHGELGFPRISHFPLVMWEKYVSKSQFYLEGSTDVKVEDFMLCESFTREVDSGLMFDGTVATR